MSRPPTDLPERLLTGDGTDFERRMIDAVLEKRPSAAASARLAKALGVTVTVTGIGTAAASKALAANAASKAGAAAASTVWPWVSLGVLGMVVAGAVVGVRARFASHPEPAPVIFPLAPAVAPGAPAEPAAEPTEATPSVPPPHRNRALAPSGDLRDEIALVDAARGALSAGSPQRALEILRRYQEKHPSGSFRPEATATRIEALVKLGHQDEARALATRFVAEHRGSLLATRVAELVGLAEPAAAP
jgi:hypothetical protein